MKEKRDIDRRADGSEGSHPHVLFVIAHDIGLQYGCYGGQGVTPHIDGIAGGGIRFDRHYCQVPLCGPSRASLFTGCRPLTTGRFDNSPFFTRFRASRPPDSGFATLPEHFRRNGYYTAASGLVFHDENDAPSWDIGRWRPPKTNETAERHSDIPLPLRSGDMADYVNDSSFELIRRRWKRLEGMGYSEEDLSDPGVLRMARGPAVEAGERSPDRADAAQYFDEKVTDRAIEYLHGAPQEAPVFLAVGYISSHTPFRAPKEYWDLYDRNTLRLPENKGIPDGSPEWVRGDVEPVQYYTTNGYTKPWLPGDEQARELLHGHLASLSFIDAQIGRLLEALRSAGKLEKTLIVVTSDHGFSDGRHRYFGKHNLWDDSQHVPLIISIPEAENGESRRGDSSIEWVTEHLQLYPGLCTLCGLPQPKHLEGRSITAPEERYAFSHRRPMWHDRIRAYSIAHGVRSDRARLNVYTGESGTVLYEELFDYLSDPEESKNLAQDPAYRRMRDEMRGALLDLLSRYACRPDFD